MSSTRQNTLFAGENFVNVYKSFKNINFTSYDFDTIRDSLIEYIRIHYPEDFNDYIESSEYIAIIELLSYLGTSLAFRTDLNARENVLDTAERRESIVKLARMLSYQPKRSIPTSGLFKIRSLRTDQNLTDSNGTQLSGVEVFWGDSNNDDWFEQFITVANSSLSPTNQFGRPSKSGSVSNIRTDLYPMNNVLGVDVSYPTTINVNGVDVPFDVVNPDFDLTMVERHPDQNQPFNMIYRNDSQGNSSPDTGLFLFLKQGRLDRSDFQYDFPKPSRIQDISSPNINNDDVYVQEIDDTGEVVSRWTKVPAVTGNNVIYNSISRQQRQIYEVISGLDDTISIKFPDGNFGDSPSGLFRMWYRVSEARNLVVRPEDARDLLITIPYYGKDGQRYNLDIRFGLERTIANGSNSETNEQIKQRAPQAFYSQDRMINSKDYNVFPLTYGNQISKLQSINRTFSGHSRYNTNDPTGFHNGLKIFGEDGAIFNERMGERRVVQLDPSITGDQTARTINQVNELLRGDKLYQFFTIQYIREIPDQNQFQFNGDVYWKTMPDVSKGSRGFFVNNDTASTPNWPFDDSIELSNVAPQKYVTGGSVVLLEDSDGVQYSTSVSSVANDGIAFDPLTSSTGPVTLGSSIGNLSKVLSVIPRFRSFLRTQERNDLESLLVDNSNVFMYFDVENDQWIFDVDGDADAEFNFNDPMANWLVCATYTPPTSTQDAFYEILSRGLITIFESLDSVRFYWDPEEVAVDQGTGRAKRDTITVIKGINTDSSNNKLEEDIKFDIVGRFMQSDGYMNPSRVRIMPSDVNEDSTPDDPYSFFKLVSPNQEVLFEIATDIDGYEVERLWTSRWVDMTDAVVDSNLAPPYDLNSIIVDINNRAFIISGDPNDPTVVSRTYTLQNNDLFIFSDLSVIEEVVRQVDMAVLSPASRIEARRFIHDFRQKSMTVGFPGDRGGINLQMYNFTTEGNRAYIANDPLHYSRIGRSLPLRQDVESENPLYFKWDHYVSQEQLVDPSSTNIIDMVIMTNLYVRDVNEWKSNGANGDMPDAPSSQDLRESFIDLNENKSISDEIVFSSGKFKPLFGNGADPKMRARFKAVKVSDSTMSDNEIKTNIIRAIDQFFDINNWSFGEKFYFTELSAYIHSTMASHLSSVVIVPTERDANFGDLFEIGSEPNELFISTATVMDVDIVSKLNESNLRY